MVQLLVWYAQGPGFKAQSLALQEQKDLVDPCTLMSKTFRTQGGNKEGETAELSAATHHRETCCSLRPAKLEQLGQHLELSIEI